MAYLFPLILITLVNTNIVYGFVEGLYCGKENCYDVLGETRDSKREEIAKSYRRLAKKSHPDVHRGEEAKAEASKRFLVIASAYEVLKDEESRRDYDYMLDNPEEMYRHYYNYYRRIYAPKVDVRIVVVFTITIISALQYWAASSRYQEAIDYFLTVPKYRMKATTIAKDEGLITNTSAYKRKNRLKSREQIKLEEESILKNIIEEKMDIGGAYSKPDWKEVLWVQLIFLPYTIVLWTKFYIRWFYKFYLMKEEYEDEEKEYLIRRYMKLSEGQWKALEDDERSDYLYDELWRWDVFSEWKQERDDEAKKKMAESGQYKRYRRWMKKGGAGTISFLED